MKKLILIVFLLYISVIRAQYTLIPDYYFESFLVGSGIDTDGVINGQVLTADIADETQLILTFDNNITDLAGIEDFASLEILDVYNMDLLEIDLSQNINLRRLDINDVSLESLDLSANINLVQFYLSLNYGEGDYTSSITEIDLSNNSLLHTLSVRNTIILELDLSNNINLQVLFIENTQTLSILNLSNGNNLELTLLEIENNTNLTCMQVDDPEAVIEALVYPYSNWVIEGNPLLEILENCDLGVNEVLDTKISIYPNPTSNYIIIDSEYPIESIKFYSIQGKLVLKENNLTSRVNISHLPTGVYFIKIETYKGSVFKRLLKN